MYFLNYVCYTWCHGQHLVDSSIALFSQSLTLPNVCVSILSKLLIALMGFPSLGAVFQMETAHERAQSKLNDMHNAWYVLSQCRPLDSVGVKG